MKIAENVAMLDVKFAENGNFVHLTLVWGEGHLVLIDAGFPGQTDAIIQAIAGEGFRVEDLTEIILTHQDIDHVGCVSDLLKLAPKAKVLAHVEEAPYIDGRKTPIKLATMLQNYDNLPEERKAWFNMIKTGFANIHISVSQTLTDGELLPICGGIEVVYTPGHTPGHICLFLRESRIMVGGDAVNIADGHLTGPNSQNTYDMKLGFQSFEKIKSFNPDGVISYHCGYLKMKLS